MATTITTASQSSHNNYNNNKTTHSKRIKKNFFLLLKMVTMRVQQQKNKSMQASIHCITNYNNITNVQCVFNIVTEIFVRMYEYMNE